MQSEVDLETLTARLERSQRVAAELAVVTKAVCDLAGSITISEIGEVATRTARELTGAAECVLWVRGENSEVRLAARSNGVQSIESIGDGRDELLSKALECGGMAVDDENGLPEASSNSVHRRVALPVLFQREAVGVLELENLASPEHGGDRMLALNRVIPMLGLALRNALVTDQNTRVNERLRQSLDTLEQSNRELRSQNETVSAQAEEIIAQNEEIRAQNEELQAQRAEILARVEENAQLLRQTIEEKNRSEAIIAASADGIMVMDADKRIAAVNRAVETMTGYRAEDLIDQPCSHLLDACDSTGACLCDFACPHLGSDLLMNRIVDSTISTREGEKVWVGIATGVVRDEESGEIRGIVHTFRDMTKYKEADRMRDEFISVASHELMTPLTALKGFAQLAHRIGSKSGENGSLMRALDVLNEEADKLVALVTRLVDASRMEAKRLEVRKADFELFALAEEVISRLRATTSRHNIRLAGSEPAPVYADRDQIEQVLTNLIGNAVKYSPLGGDIDVRVDRQEGYVQVSVTDQGIGIPAEKQGRVFDRFYQAHDGPRGYSKGMGIGLHICKEIVSLHGGHIWVRSEEGRGSTFYFTLTERGDDRHDSDF